MVSGGGGEVRPEGGGGEGEEVDLVGAHTRVLQGVDPPHALPGRPEEEVEPHEEQIGGLS